jgi:hypothetical protein
MRIESQVLALTMITAIVSGKTIPTFLGKRRLSESSTPEGPSKAATYPKL